MYNEQGWMIIEQWMKNNEEGSMIKWIMKDEQWMMNNKQWTMTNEWWTMNKDQ